MCCESSSHSARDCTAEIKCYVCSSSRHSTVLHVESPNSPSKGTTQKSLVNPSVNSMANNGEEKSEVNTKCLQVCGDKVECKSCAKTVLVNVYRQNNSYVCHL